LKNTFTATGPITMMRWVLACATLCAAASAHAQDRAPMVDLINAYRAAPGTCEGRQAVPVAPLAPEPALARVQVASGAFLEQALERAGYPVARAEAIHVSGAANARSVMDAIEQKYCRTLLSTQFSAIGITRTGDQWLIVLAQPAPPSPVSRLPDLRDAGERILEAVNAVRATGTRCGEQRFAAVPALSWNDALGNAALAHSADMARQRYFSHIGKDGRAVADRALQAGYRWRRVGENIASGLDSAEEAVSGWLSSPGHCANIMNRDFTEMGAAYAISSSREVARIYWTQVFGTPR
jgi:uncharacterized protein YkwD